MNNIERLTLQLIGEDPDNPDVFVDVSEGMTPIRDSINAAIQEICMLSGAYPRTIQVPLIKGRLFYRLEPVHDAVAYILEVFDRVPHRKLLQTSPGNLTKSDPWWLRRTGVSPTHYFPLGTNGLCIYPTIGSTGRVLEVRAAMVPKPYAHDTSTIRLKPAFERAAAFYAASEFYASRGAAERANEMLAEYVSIAGFAITSEPAASGRTYQMGGDRWMPSMPTRPRT